MSVDITCPVCGLECERVRVAEDTFSHECPDCDYGESLLRLLPDALYELAVFTIVELPKWVGAWVWRRMTSAWSRLGVMTTRSASAPDADPEADTQ